MRKGHPAPPNHPWKNTDWRKCHRCGELKGAIAFSTNSRYENGKDRVCNGCRAQARDSKKSAKWYMRARPNV